MDTVTVILFLGIVGVILVSNKTVSRAAGRWLGLVSSNRIKAQGSGKPRGSAVYDQGDEPLPEPTPLLHLTPETLKTFEDRPWRPFRWPYHQTMSIFKLDINHWLDMDKSFYRYIKSREEVYKEHGKEYCDALPGSEDACQELMEVVIDHVLKRYPKLYRKTEFGIDNLITSGYFKYS